MQVEKISSFSISDTVGGNPAGVVILDAFPSVAKMQTCAAEVGFSETAFAHREGDGWRVKFFSPVGEVGFCGHATIALGTVLATRFGSAEYPLRLNDFDITVDATGASQGMFATLMSPPTSHAAPDSSFLETAMALFELTPDDLDPAIVPVIASAGVRHLVLPLISRITLADMRYELDAGAKVMAQEDLITIMLVHAENDRLFHVRNPFASGGVYEDPATGAAAAAFGGYLNAIGWPHEGEITILQGEDMGMPSRINVTLSGEPGSPVRVGGRTRIMTSVD